MVVEASGPSAKEPRGARALAAGAAFVIALLAKLPQLGFTHKEPDEVIYWQLAQRLWQDGAYSLRGTRVLELLPASMYDHALFHHPPLFAALLGPWAANSAALLPPAGALWVTFLAHAIFAAAVAATGLRLAQRAGGTASVGVALAAGAAAALDPFGWFAARFLWIDAVSMACAAVAAWCALGRTGRGWFVGAGVACGLALLAKLTGGVVLLALVFERLARRDGRAGRARDLAALVLPAALMAGAWLAVFAAHTGALLPTWIAPDDGVLARDALMRAGFERSPLAYAWLVVLVQPLVVWTALALWRRRDDAHLVALTVWYLGGGALIAATSLLGTTPVLTRQLAPVQAALYIAAIALFVRLDDARWRAAFGVCVAVAAAGAWRDVHGTSVYELRGLAGWF